MIVKFLSGLRSGASELRLDFLLTKQPGLFSTAGGAHVLRLRPVHNTGAVCASP